MLCWFFPDFVHHFSRPAFLYRRPNDPYPPDNFWTRSFLLPYLSLFLCLFLPLQLCPSKVQICLPNVPIWLLHISIDKVSPCRRLCYFFIYMCWSYYISLLICQFSCLFCDQFLAFFLFLFSSFFSQHLRFQGGEGKRGHASLDMVVQLATYWYYYSAASWHFLLDPGLILSWPPFGIIHALTWPRVDLSLISMSHGSLTQWRPKTTDLPLDSASDHIAHMLACLHGCLLADLRFQMGEGKRGHASLDMVVQLATYWYYYSAASWHFLLDPGLILSWPPFGIIHALTWPRVDLSLISMSHGSLTQWRPKTTDLPLDSASDHIAHMLACLHGCLLAGLFAYHRVY